MFDKKIRIFMRILVLVFNIVTQADFYYYKKKTTSLIIVVDIFRKRN